MNTEIQVNYPKALEALTNISALQGGSGYKIYMTTNLMNSGSGKMCEQVNLMQRELEKVEDHLLEIIKKTSKALCEGMKEFIDADDECAKMIAIKLNEMSEMNECE